uniref:Uncharacterized protein LOC778577 n=1 Tax=Phallusia mammillata TaxID=59560 RepID=A0A6F9DJP2_9ASCI|nr:uncharacterized protein LOC778577 [Phallusia mammillata]
MAAQVALRRQQAADVKKGVRVDGSETTSSLSESIQSRSASDGGTAALRARSKTLRTVSSLTKTMLGSMQENASRQNLPPLTERMRKRKAFADKELDDAMMQREMSFACGMASNKPYAMPQPRAGNHLIFPAQPIMHGAALMRMGENPTVPQIRSQWTPKEQQVAMFPGLSQAGKFNAPISPPETTLMYGPKLEMGKPVKNEHSRFDSPNSVASMEQCSSDEGSGGLKRRKTAPSALKSPIQNGAHLAKATSKQTNSVPFVDNLKVDPRLANRLHALYSMFPDCNPERINSLLKFYDGAMYKAAGNAERNTFPCNAKPCPGFPDCTDAQCALNSTQSVFHQSTLNPLSYNKLMTDSTRSPENWLYKYPLPTYNAPVRNLFKYPPLNCNNLTFRGVGAATSDAQLHNNLLRLSNLVYAENMARAAQDALGAHPDPNLTPRTASVDSGTNLEDTKGSRKRSRKASSKDKSNAPKAPPGPSQSFSVGFEKFSRTEVKEDSGRGSSPEVYGLHLHQSDHTKLSPVRSDSRNNGDLVNHCFSESRNDNSGKSPSCGTAPRIDLNTPQQFVRMFNDFVPSPPRKHKITPFTVQSIIGRANA